MLILYLLPKRSLQGIEIVQECLRSGHSSFPLEALLARAAPPDEDVEFLANLLSLPASEGHPLLNTSPQRKKERTLEALIG